MFITAYIVITSMVDYRNPESLLYSNDLSVLGIFLQIPDTSTIIFQIP